MGSQERLRISLTWVYIETVQRGASWRGYLAPREVGAGGPGPGLAQAETGWEFKYEFCLTVNIFFSFAFSRRFHLSKHFLSHKYHRISLDQSG